MINKKIQMLFLVICSALLVSQAWAITPTYTIYDIQFTNDPSGDSPYKGQTVATSGVVTAFFPGYGYFIEDSSGPWTGLFIYDTNEPAIGDLVSLTGVVNEYYGLTELWLLSSYSVLSSGNPLPFPPEILLTGDVSQEQWEGVLLEVQNVTVTDDDLGYGEWSVDDGSGNAIIDDRGSYTYTPTFGDTLSSVIGPLDYSYGAFKILPRYDDDITISATAPIPEPATMLLLGAGLAGLAGLRRKFRKP